MAGLEITTADFGTMGERFYGYAPALRCGDTVYVSGQTASAEEGEEDPPADMEAQMRRAYAKVARALGVLGAGMGDVVDETLFVTDVATAGRVAGGVRHEAYGARPRVASTLVEVSRLAGAGLLVEIKCTARVAIT